MNPAHLEEAFNLLVAAAGAGERCPQSWPHGPLRSGTVPALCEAGRIRSEVYAKNWRVVTILTGEAKGKRTMAAPSSGPPYSINGRIPGRSRVATGVRRHIRMGDGGRAGTAPNGKREGPAPITLAKINLPPLDGEDGP